LVLGGEHVTADYEYILRNFPEVDFCILGEGEEKLKNLARSLPQSGLNFSRIEGITFFDRSANQVVTNSFAYRIKNIDEMKTMYDKTNVSKEAEDTGLYG
jgi:radical SAM superfamily enzyme YgiQ (UPF0313 family)